MRHITERERALRQTIYELTAAKPGRDTQPIQDVQEGIYAETGLLATTHLSLDDLTFLHTDCLAPATRKMLSLAGRDEPELISMYDLRHSLLSCAGADAAVKIQQAELLCKVVVKRITTRLQEAKADGKETCQVEPVRLLELGSGISDVTSMVWALVMQELRRSEILKRPGGGCVGGRQDAPDDAALQQLFHITNVEYSEPTGRTAAVLLDRAGRSNVSVRYGPVIGDATVLRGLKGSTFDVVWSSLMLGAFDALPVEKDQSDFSDGYSTASNVSNGGSDAQSPKRATRDDEGMVIMDVPGARAVLDQAWRVAKDGATICHSGFAYLVKPDDPPGTVFPWRTDDPQPRLPVDYMMRFNSPLRRLTRRFTDVEFDYWKWVDGGDFARYECEQGLAAGRYRSLKVQRSAGYISWPVPMMRATWKLVMSGADPQATLGEDVFESCMALTRSGGPSFTTSTVVVEKAAY